MKKRVLLINPPYPIEESPSPPFGLMSLAAYLLENGFEVIIEDYITTPFSRKRLEKIINEFNPGVIGATGVTMNINKSISIIKDCKEISPESITVLGGPHVTFDAENILSQNRCVDVVVRGEGELTMVEFLNSCKDMPAYPGIKGISYRDMDKVVHNEGREFIQDINILPLPARHLVKLSKYRALGLPVNMVTSRGCPFECIFCVGSRMVGRKVRYFDVKRVVDEFEMLSKLGFSQINVVDDLFTSHRKRCIEICDEITARGIEHKWTAFARVDTVSPELLQAMKRAGCSALCFGIESGNQGILDRVKKKTNLGMCRSAIQMCRDAGIDPMTSYILGLPGETSETVLETLDFARNLSSSYGYHILAPFPGTEVRDKSEEYNMKILTDDWDRYDANQSVAESISLPHQEVDRVVNDFYNGIKRIVESTIENYESGKDTSDSSRDLVKNLRSLDFSLKLINGELIEDYSSHIETNGGHDLNSFVEFLSGRMNLDKGMVSLEVERLFRLRCLIDSEGGSGPQLLWA